MRVVVDMQGMQTSFSAHRGVGRYTEQLVRQLVRTAAGRHEVFLALNGSMPEGVDRVRARFAGLVPEERFVVWQQFFDTTQCVGPSPWLVAAGEVLREAVLNRIRPDVIFAPNLQEGWFDPAVTSVRRLATPALYCSTLHDLVPLHYEEDYLGDPAVRQWYFRKIGYAKASDVLVTVSQASRREIIEFLGVAPEKVVVVENGYDSALFHAVSDAPQWVTQVRQRYGVEGAFVLYVGGNDRHKNIGRLLSAFAALPEDLRHSFALVLAGREFARDDALSSQIRTLGLEGRVLTPGFVDDEDLPVLMRACSCFVFPSTHEGFGLPALEAMACGVPVIGAAGSAVEEIIGDRRALFDPFDVQDMSGRLALVLRDSRLRGELIEQGLARAAGFSWEKAANILWGVWEDIIGARSRWEGAGEVTEQTVIDAVAALGMVPSADALRAFARSLAESFPEPRPPAVFLDVSAVVVQDDRSGIQRVTRAVACELAGRQVRGREIAAVYASPEVPGFRVANRYMREVFGLERPVADEVVDFVPGDVLLFLDLHPGVAIGQQQYIQYLRRKGVKVFHVVYDLIPALRPEFFWPELCAQFREWLAVVAASDGAVCISRAVAEELRTYILTQGLMRGNEFKIGWFHLGADLARSVPTRGIPPQGEALLAHLSSGISFLMVGTVEPRKGHRQVLAAFERLWQSGLAVNLVVVGRQGWGMDSFVEHLRQHPEQGRRLFYVQQISDEFLERLYAVASCLIAASECEGFGLPLIEAAQRGLPVIARDIPVFREVAGDYAYYFADTSEPEVIASCIRQWIDEGMALPRRARTWMTWQQSAQRLLEVVLEGEWMFHLKGSQQLSMDSDSLRVR